MQMKLPGFCVAAASLTLVFVTNCGWKPQKKEMQVGDKIILQPVNKMDLASLTKEPSHVHLVFDLGGKELQYTDQTKIRGFRKVGDTTPVVEFEASELEHMYSDTECPRDVSAVLENAYQGDAMFCNNSLKLSEINYWVALRHGKSNKAATSVHTNNIDRDLGVISVTVPFR